jgi:hypothetical protein
MEYDEGAESIDVLLPIELGRHQYQYNGPSPEHAHDASEYASEYRSHFRSVRPEAG